MSDFIGIDVQGLEQVQAKLAKLPDEARNAIVDDVSTYMVNSLCMYPPQKSVSLKQAYGGFKSDKQRRYFFAALADGRIQVPYRRTQTLARGWKQVGKGYSSIIANETAYAGLVMGDGQQANMMRIIGWKTLQAQVNERMARVTSILDGAIKKAIRKLGLG